MKRLVFAIAVLSLLLSAFQVWAAVPKIDISGTTGGAHWAWYEAENKTDAVGFPGSFKNMTEISGHVNTEPYVANELQLVYQADPYFQVSVHAPAAMSSNTKVLVHAGSTNGGQNVLVFLDWSSVGWMNYTYDPNGVVAGWTQRALPAISGDHNVQFYTAGWDSQQVDGILLYDGDISPSGAPSTVAGPGDSYWMDANMTPNSRPVLGDSITPQIAVTGAASVSYWLTCNGVTSAYTPGTQIVGGGDYRLWAEAWGDNSNLYPQQRMLAGVDFKLVPEPGSILTLFAGMAGLLGFRRRK